MRKSPHAASPPAVDVPDGRVLGERPFLTTAGPLLAHGEADLVLVDVGGSPRTGADDDLHRALLVAAETRLVNSVRPHDKVGRLEDGRLAVLASRGRKGSAADQIARRVAALLAEPFSIGGREHTVEPLIKTFSDQAATDVLFASRERA